MIVPVMAISNLVLTRQVYSEETNGAHAHYREPVPLNARSLVKNQDALAHLLANINHKFSVLDITETWVKESNVNRSNEKLLKYKTYKNNLTTSNTVLNVFLSYF